jgi:hypothetical protein
MFHGSRGTVESGDPLSGLGSPLDRNIPSLSAARGGFSLPPGGSSVPSEVLGVILANGALAVVARVEVAPVVLSGAARGAVVTVQGQREVPGSIPVSLPWVRSVVTTPAVLAKPVSQLSFLA